MGSNLHKGLSEEPSVHPTATVRDCTLGAWTEVGEGCSLIDVEFGDYAYIVGGGQAIHATIGKFASIAAATRINPGNHPTWRPSQHHFTYRAGDYFSDAENEAAFFDWRKEHRVTVGHDVWIGHGAVILPGVAIADGAVVAAGAVVSRPVDPYAIVAGVPARCIGERFARPVWERLRALAWWDWPHRRLRAALQDFRTLSVETFLERHE